MTKKLLKTRNLLFIPVFLLSIAGLSLGVNQSTNASQVPSTANEISVADIGGENSYIVTLAPPSIGGDSERTNLEQDEQIEATQQIVIERNTDVIEEEETTTFENIPAFSANLDPEDISELEADPLVQSVQPNMIRFSQLNQSVPHINSDTVTTNGFGGEGTAIAVLDTGVARHEFVNIVSDACYSNNGGFGGGISVCRDGSTSSTLQDSGDACAEIAAGCDHGTHVAGIAAGNNNQPRINLSTSLAEVGFGNFVDVAISVSAGAEPITGFDFSFTHDANTSFVSFTDATTDQFTTTVNGDTADFEIALSGTISAGSTSDDDIEIGIIRLNAEATAPIQSQLSFDRTLNPATFTTLTQTIKPSHGLLRLPISATDTAGSLDTESTNVSFTGVAPEANIIAIQVFTTYSESLCNLFFGYSPCLGASDGDILAGLDRVLELQNDPAFPYEIAAANLSLGGGLFATQSECNAATGTSYATAIGNLADAGIATIIAAGNEGSSTAISAPGCVENAIAVGSTTISDAVSGFSNSNALVELLAPGSNISSSVPGGGFSNFSGTSMATPHVAGVWAQLKQASQDATVDEILVALQENGSTIIDSRNSLPFTRADTLAAYNEVTEPIQVTTLQDFTSEDQTTATVEFSLLSEPTSDVTIPISLSDATEAQIQGDITEVTITNASWDTPANNQIVIEGIDDTIKDGNTQFQLITGDPASVDPAYDALTAAESPDTTLTNRDNEIYSISYLYEKDASKTSIWTSAGDAANGLTPATENADLFWWNHNSAKLGGSGDFNGDGFVDQVLYYKIGGGKTKIYVSHGSASGLRVPSLVKTLTWWNWDSITPFPAGDFNGDGLDDVGVFYRRGDSGANVWILNGNETTTLNGPKRTHQLTWWNYDAIKPAAGDDFNGDGFDDVLAYHRSGSSGTNAWLIQGSASNTGSPVSLGRNLPSTPWNDIEAGQSTDTNGDGYSDAVILQSKGTSTSIQTLFGGNDGLSDIVENSNLFWWSHASTKVGGSGDFNGDGFGDLALLYRRGGGALKMYVSYGTATGLRTPPTVYEDFSKEWSAIRPMGGF